MNSMSHFKPEDRVQCVAGLSLMPDYAQLVVLSGAHAPQEVLCAEYLPMPSGFWREGELVDPQGVGLWILSFLQSRDLQPDSVSLGVDPHGLTWRTVTLPADLTNEDLAFQMMAELLDGRVQLADQICIDYVALPSSSGWQEQHTKYKTVMTSALRVKGLRSVARYAHLSVRAIEPTTQASERTHQFQAFIQRSSVSAAGVLMCDEACGLALSHWDDEVGINFFPLHLEAAQRQQRNWAFRMAAGVVTGVVMSLGVSFLLNLTAQAERDSLKGAYSVTRSLDEVRKVNLELTQQIQRQRNSTMHSKNSSNAPLRDV